MKSSPEALRAAGVLLDEAVAEGAMDLAAIFGNLRPVEIEIGSGKGAFLLRRASDRPEVNLLGVEWLAGYATLAADRVYRAGIKNVRLLCADAGQIFAQCLADGSVQRAHIYFPDPWPKRKHLRRRLIKSEFVRNLRRVLQIGGTVHIATDHVKYFQQIRRAMETVEGLAIIRPGGTEIVGSNFERKYAAEGRNFHTIVVIKYK